MGVDNHPWDSLSRDGSAGFTILIDRMRAALEDSPRALEVHIPPRGQWCTTIMVRVGGKFEHVVSVPFENVDTALQAYTELASMYLSDAASVGIREDLRVPLARTIGRALAFADHRSDEYGEHVDHLIGRGGESLILGAVLIAVSGW